MNLRHVPLLRMPYFYLFLNPVRVRKLNSVSSSFLASISFSEIGTVSYLSLYPQCLAQSTCLVNNSLVSEWKGSANYSEHHYLSSSSEYIL